MADISFDDLIPKSEGKKPAPEISFDDLIPQKGFWDLLPKGVLGSQGDPESAPLEGEAYLDSRGKPVGSTVKGLKGIGGEMLKGVPIAGAYAPQTGIMNEMERDNPAIAKISRGMGSVAAALPVMAAAPATFGLTGSLGARTVGGGLSGGTLQGFDTLARTGDLEKAGDDALRSALTIGLLTPAFSAASSVISPALQKGARYLMDKGIKLTPGQMLGGLAKKTEDAVEGIPIAGVGVAQARSKSIEGFNRAAANDALAPIGQSLPKGVESGYEARQHVREAIQGHYTSAFKNTQMSLTPQLQKDVADAQAAAISKYLLPEKEQKQLQSLIDSQISGKFGTAKGTVKGDLLKDIDSELRSRAEQRLADPSADSQNLGAAIEDVRKAYFKNFAAQNPKAAAMVDASDKSWAHYVRLRGAGSSTAVEGVEGNFTPTQLAMSAKREDASLGKRAFSEGDALFQELAQHGKAVLPKTIPNSGTADRILAAILLESMFTKPVTTAIAAVPAIAGKMAYSEPSQALARALIAGSPQTRGAIAEAARQYGPRLGLAAQGQQPQKPDNEALARALMQR
jgi:hypothetical protein